MGTEGGRRRAAIWRAVAVLALAGMVGGMLAAGSAGAAKFAKKKKVYTKKQADGRFLNVGEGLPGTVHYRKGTAIEIAPNEEERSTVACPPGTEVVGGGGYGSSADTVITVSAPTDANADAGTTHWTAYARNDDSSDSHSITAHAICVDAASIDANFAPGGDPTRVP